MKIFKNLQLIFDLKKWYSRLYGIEESTYVVAAKFRAAFKYAFISFTFAQNAINALFLTVLSERLPWIYIVSPFVIILFSLFFSSMGQRIEKKKMLSAFLLLTSFFYLSLRFILAPNNPVFRSFLFVAYLIIEVYMAIFMIMFYTSFNETLTSKERKKVIPFILAGGAAATGLSAFIILFISSPFVTRHIIFSISDYFIVAAIFNFLTINEFMKIPDIRSQGLIMGSYFTKFIPKNIKKDLKRIGSLRSKYLFYFMIIMFVSFSIITLIDYNFKITMARNYLRESDLSMLFGLYRGAASLITYVFQNFLFSRIIPFIGTINLFNIYPFILTINALFIVAFAGFWSSFSIKTSSDVFKNMFEDTSIQFFYNPIPLIQKGKIISFIEGLIKPFSLIMIGFLLTYIRNIPQIIPYLILLFSIIYLVFSYLIKKEYFRAFYRKISYEKDILKPQIPDIERSHINKDLINSLLKDEKLVDEVFIYYLKDLEDKMEEANIKDLWERFSEKYHESMIKYIVRHYDPSFIGELTHNSKTDVKVTVLKELIKHKKLQKGFNYYNMKELYDILPFEISKEICNIVQPKTGIRNTSDLVKFLNTTPYAIGRIKGDLEAIPFKTKYLEDLFAILRLYDIPELVDYLGKNISKFDPDELYRFMYLSAYFKKPVPVSKKIYDAIENEIYSLTFLYNLNLVTMKRRYDLFLHEFVMEKAYSLLFTTLYIFRPDYVDMIQRTEHNKYLISEIILFLEEKERFKGKEKELFKNILELVDRVYNSTKHIKGGDNIIFSPMDSYLIKMFDSSPNNNNKYKECIMAKNNLETMFLLKKVELFSRINFIKLESLAAMVEERSYKKNEIIIKEGKVGDGLYIVKNGKAEVFKNYPAPTPIKELSANNWFGELSIISDQAHLASVRALTDIDLIKIKRDTFKVFVLNNPEISFKIFEILVSYLKELQSVGDTL